MAINLIVNNADATVEPGSRLDYALRYAALGWHVFPAYPIKDGVCSCGSAECKSPGKHPLSEAAPFGQSQATTDKAQITKWWQRHPQANIAVLLAKSNLCAIDIDPRNGGHYTIDELESKHGALQADVLAFTGGGGEHRVFELPTGMNLPGKLGKGIDVKVNGYIVVEPSNHISGGVYEWEASSNPLEGAIPSPLPDWLRDLARVVHVVDDAVAASSKQITEAELAEISAALPFIDADDRQTWLDVGMALHSDVGGSLGFDLWSNWSMSSHKFKQSDQLRVWRSFKSKGISGITKATLFKLAMEGGWRNTGTVSIETPAIDIESLVKKPAPSVQVDFTGRMPTQFPVSVMNELVEWIETFEELPTRSITMQGVLALTATLAGRIYKSTNSNDSSLYLMTLADTGKGKGYPAKAIKNLMVAAGYSSMVQGSGNTSASAVFSALRHAPCHIQISDEIGKQYAAARKQNGGHLAEAFNQLTIAYSETDSTMLPRNFSTETIPDHQIQRKDRFIVHPSITLFSFATLEQVFNNLTSSEIDDGFLNRQIVVHADDDHLPERERTFYPPSDSLIEWAKAIRNIAATPDNLSGIETPANMSPSPVVVTITPDAKALFKAFKTEVRSFEGDRLKIAIRWNENAMRMATGLAVANDASHPVISKQIAEWCIYYVRFHGERFYELVTQNVADNETHRLRNQVLTAIEKAGHDGRTYGQLSYYCRLWKGASLQQRDNIIESLKREDLIIEAKPAAKSGRGRKASMSVYFHRQWVRPLDEEV